MQQGDGNAPNVRAVWDRLAEVMDPELDEPITEMGFVETVSVSETNQVEVSFRLPTFWCSPNFAFLMAQGIREEVGSLPWVQGIEVQLQDHMCADEMNEAVNSGRSFSEAFALPPEFGDLAEVKEKFEGKAFQRRQESVLVGLQQKGFTPAQVAAMTLGQLDLVSFDDPVTARQQGRYRAVLTARGLAKTADDHAFPDLDGTRLSEETYPARLEALRAVRINMEFGGALCRGLKQSRYKEIVRLGGQPALCDSQADRVPPRAKPG
ncbi:MAG: iron-sulfur cluster assembly protein [Rhodovibrio sp.]|nr:iron-sulfur cluster assembly protein [Rhodovibrio sp.]